MPSGYSGTPLAKKLGIKQGFKILTINAPDYYYNLFEELPQDIREVTEGESGVNFIHFFTKKREELESRFGDLKSLLDINGMIWVSWPKKASKVPTDIDDSVVRKNGLDHGLVDVKVCAIDDVWSGLKFVYRKEDRK